MKFLIGCFFIVLLQGVHAQVCTGNFVFNTQTQIDQFLIDNPTCTIIDGDVTIDDAIGQTNNFITNVNALQNITHVTGSLRISANAGPFDLGGLSELSTVGWELKIAEPISQTYIQNLLGLQNLNSVGRLSLTIHEFSSFWVFDNLWSADHISMNINSSYDPVILEDIFPGIYELSDGFNCTIWDADYVIFTGMNSLYSAGDISFTSWGDVDLFDAFNNLISLSGSLFMDVPELHYFVSGFGSLNSVGENIQILSNTDGSTYPDFGQLESVGNQFSLYGGGLSLSPLHFSSLIDVNEIVITGQFPEVHFDALQSVHDVTIQKDIWVSNYWNQTTFYFPSLSSIQGVCILDGLDAMTDLSGFPVLNQLGWVVIQNCPNLTECAIEAVCERLSINPAAVTINNNAPGCNTIDEVLNDCEFSYISGQVYADLNCDGVYNTGDVHFQNSLIHNQNELPVGSINANGSYYVVIPESSTIQIHAMVPPGFLDGPEYSVTYAYAEDYLNYNFPLCPNMNFHDVRVYGNLHSPRPGYTCEYFIHLKNEVVPTESVLLTLDFSNMPGASVSSTDGAVSGNTVTWTVNDLTFMETNLFNVEFYVDPSTPLGTIYNPIVTATLLSAAADDDPEDNIFSLFQTVVGSYDPNDKTVNRPAIDVAEIPTDDGVWLDYTIRFQNTGTAEAITVRVDDFITENLDLTTFQSLDASHDYVVSFKEDRKVEWLFDNIMLPDSTTNEPESHGFIHFKIKTVSGLGVADTIENYVAIYFDFNEPVITNTATTIFYECTQNAEIGGLVDSCEGGDITLDASGVWDNYHWFINGDSMGTSNQLMIENVSSGIQTITLQVSDVHCSDEAEFLLDITARPATPVITQAGNVLTASGSGTFEWSMNGEILADTDNSIEITESNTYSVVVTEDVCASEMNTGTFDLFICPAPLQLPQDLSICVGETVELNVPDEYLSLEWKWMESDEVIDTSADLSFSPEVSGTISVTGVSYHCNSTDALFVTINPIPATPVITQAGNTLTASGSGTFEWSMNGEILADTDNSIEITESSTYSVVVTEDVCASEMSTGTFDLFICPAPLQLPGDISICVGETVQLNVPDEYLSLEWKWMESDEVIGTSADLSFSPEVSGTISVTGVSYHCNSTDALFVTINPIPATPVITQAGNTLTASGSGTFEWSMNGEVLADTDNSIEITESNIYSVVVTEDICASEISTGTFDLFLCPAPLQLPGDISICVGETVQLNVPDEYLSLEWKWMESDEVIGTTADLSFMPTTSGTIMVSGVSYHCNSTDALFVTINPIPATPEITQAGNTLTASGSGTFEWSMNGEILADTDNSIEITESNTYSVVVTEDVCASEMSTGTFDLFICPAPLQLPGDISICVGEAVQLNVPDEYLSLEWKWMETDEVIGTTADISFTPTTSGTIMVSGISYDCNSIDALFVTINPIPATPVITQAGNTLTASGSGTYEWSMNGEILPDTDNAIVITETNVYSVSVNENGCFSEFASGTFDYFECPAPLELPQELSSCAGDGVQLNVPDDYLSLEWIWQESGEILGTSAELSFTPTSSGTIMVSGVSYDCSSTDVLFVTVNPIPATPVITQFGNTLTASGSGTFEWSMNGEVLLDTDNSIEITESNMYSVSVTENGCNSETTSGTFTYTGMEEFNGSNVHVYPNPASEVVYLNVPNTGTWNLEIMSTDGRLLQKTQFSGGTKAVDIMPEWCGLLMIKLMNQNTGEEVKRKIIVAR